MNFKRLLKAILSEAGLIVVAAILFLLIGYEVLVTGMIRNLISIGIAKYPLAITLFLFGAIVFFVGIKAVAKNYQEIKK